jgi:hypothetical protein
MRAGISTTVLHVNAALTGEPHPEPLPPHRIMRSCDDALGYPNCYGSAGMGPERCTCDTLTDEQHALCVAEGWAAFHARSGRMCDDCAFRKGSPEAEQLTRIAASSVPFRCHKGMPVDAKGGEPVRDAYCPRTSSNHWSVEATEYPVCAGWKRARAAQARR